MFTQHVWPAWLHQTQAGYQACQLQFASLDVMTCIWNSSGPRMPPPVDRQDDAVSTMSVLTLPPEMLQLVCTFLEDPDDLASCHMVHTRSVCKLYLMCSRHHRVRCKLLDGLAADAAINILHFVNPCSRDHDIKGLSKYCMVQVLRSSKSCNDERRAAAFRLP
jgi:hypothetical protein